MACANGKRRWHNQVDIEKMCTRRTGLRLTLFLLGSTWATVGSKATKRPYSITVEVATLACASVKLKTPSLSALCEKRGAAILPALESRRLGATRCRNTQKALDASLALRFRAALATGKRQLNNRRSQRRWRARLVERTDGTGRESGTSGGVSRVTPSAVMNSLTNALVVSGCSRFRRNAIRGAGSLVSPEPTPRRSL
jgi:hypothetical protein